jgi:N-acetylated-alpha-linked acidic dipeptidase
MINGVARSVTDPETGVTAWKRMQQRTILNGSTAERSQARSGGDLRIGALGSGSDYSPFLQHLGIASLNMGYGGEGDGGIYHSAYDDFYWFTHFSDSSFVYGRALAQTVGTTIMRLAGADVLPLAFSNLAATADRYATEVQALRERRADDIAETIRQVEDSTFIITNDPRNPLLPPATETVPPHFEFAPLLDAVDALTRASAEYEKQYAAWLERRSGNASPSAADAASYRALNERLLQAERALTTAEGLKNRPWYQHLLYAPGFYTGYGVKTMPGVRESIEQGEWQEVNGEIERIAAALRRETALVTGAAAALSRL